jgi:hypothetical protein
VDVVLSGGVQPVSKRIRRRLARQAKLTHRPEQSDAAAVLHGCESCRDQDNRQELVKSLIAAGQADEAGVNARCPVCGADWSVSFFAGPKGEAHVRFAVVPREVPS